jgi:hypothetical protein
MCFPGKRQKDNFAEPKPTPPDTKAQANQSEKLSSLPAPLTQSSTSTSENDMSGPRVAIVIYSLYGHITKSASPLNVSLLIASHISHSGRGCQDWYRRCWWQRYHLPVSPTLLVSYAYIDLAAGSRRPSLRIS